MTHILQPDIALEELRRQLRDGEITYQQYKVALRTLPEPDERLCDTTGCLRTADRMDRGKALCSVCAMVARNARK
jgi:hypothetical protein